MSKKLTALFLGILFLFCSCSPTTPASSTPPDSEAGLDEADVYDWFTVPPMDHIEESYYENYIRHLIYSGLLTVNWSGEEYESIAVAPSGASQTNNLIMAFESIIGEDAMQSLLNEHGEAPPADIVEEVLLQQFPFTVEQLHEILFSCYDAQADTYTYGGGSGGGSLEAAVVDVEDAGEFVYLSYEFFSSFSGTNEYPATYGYKLSGILTLQKNGDAYRCFAVEVGEEEYAEGA
jgi:hypothetical protein